MPVTTPLPEPTVAMDVLLLLQVPPVDVLDNVEVPPTHTVVPPVMTAGNGLTVIMVVVKPPPG